MTKKIANTPRKKPGQSRSRATVSAVLEAAARILEEAGALDITTNMIAERAGVSIGSLYQYFPSKEAIFAEMIRAERERLLARMEDVRDRMQSLDGEQALEALVAAAVQQQLDRPGMARALDFIEPMLKLDDETRALERRIGEVIGEWLDAAVPGLDIHQRLTTVRDLLAIAKAIIDAAGSAGERDRRALQDRVLRALTGYLGTR